MKTTSRSDLKKKLTENRGYSSLEMKLEHFHEKQKQLLQFHEKNHTQINNNFCAINVYVYCTFKNV